MPDPDRPVDFFVSHADADLEWAEWIAAELESAGYGVIVKAWDFRPGENILARHDETLATCRHTICVLSEHYVDSEAAVRTAAQYQDQTGKETPSDPGQGGRLRPAADAGADHRDRPVRHRGPRRGAPPAAGRGRRAGRAGGPPRLPRVPWRQDPVPWHTRRNMGAARASRGPVLHGQGRCARRPAPRPASGPSDLYRPGDHGSRGPGQDRHSGGVRIPARRRL